MTASFFDHLCKTRADCAGLPAASDPAASHSLSHHLRQMRRLIITRQAPIPATRKGDRHTVDETSLQHLDRLLTYGFEQPGRIRVGKDKDVENLTVMVTNCFTRNFANTRVVVTPGGLKTDLGRTIVPVNVRVITKDAGSPSLDLRLDRLSRDIEMAGDTSASIS